MNMKRFEKTYFLYVRTRDLTGHPRGLLQRQRGSRGKGKSSRRGLKQLGLNSEFRANESGCLDACEYGACYSYLSRTSMVWGSYS